MDAIIIGRRRLGKSTLALWLARVHHPTVIVFDPRNEYGSLPALTLEEVQEWIETQSEENGLSEIRYVPSTASTTQELDDLVSLLRNGPNPTVVDYAFIVDEAHVVQSPQSMPPGLAWLVRQAPRDLGFEASSFGNRRDISLIQVTHRPFDINSDSRGVATDFFIFRTTLLRDREYLAKQFNPEISERVEHLDYLQVLHYWYDRGNERYSVWRDSDAWRTRIG